MLQALLTHSHIHTNNYTCACTRSNAHILARKHIPAHIYIYTLTLKSTYSHVHTLTRTHTHTQFIWTSLLIIALSAIVQI